MRVLHIIEGLSPKAGGPTRSVKGLTTALARQGVDVFLFSHSPLHDWPDAAPVHFQKGSVAGGVNASYELEQAIRSFAPDIIHLHGLWTNHCDMLVASKLKIPIVLSPRGMLDPWALSVKRWKKWLAMLLYQRRDLKSVSAFHATAELEANNIRAQGFSQPIIISPNGIEEPSEKSSFCHKHCIAESKNHTAIFMGRLHPGKGLITLAEAWARIKPKNWTMRIVGPDNCGHKSEILAKLDELGVSYSDVKDCILENSSGGRMQRTSWEFVDMVDDKVKWQEYASADLLIHPSVSENFGITIAEGLASGLPVICTKGTPWKDVEDNDCGCWIDQGVDALTQALSRVFSFSPSQLSALGANGRRLIKRKYTWTTAVKPLLIAYERLIETSRKANKPINIGGDNVQ